MAQAGTSGRYIDIANQRESQNTKLAGKLLDIAERRSQNIAQEDNLRNDFTYLLNIANNSPNMSTFIEETASFADVEVERLLQEEQREQSMNFTNTNDILQHVVSPQLRSFTHLAHTNIIQLCPRLSDTQPWQFIDAGGTIRTRFARCVADTLRGSVVVNAKRYNTTTQVRTLQQSIHNHALFFKNVDIRNNQLYVINFKPPPLPLRTQMFGLA